ncbi:hypothetical protein [Virgibacillus salexigens]|uniref:hypothetical protein n=1 Tax=Virgibacillus salexigens TaxID=61016 RepID=UPI00190CDED6|nr:hypothetical protein [Virgibacillus salexigens]
MKKVHPFQGMETFFYDLEQYIKHLNPDDETLTMANVFHRSGIIPSVDGPLGTVHDFVNEEAANVHHAHF